MLKDEVITGLQRIISSFPSPLNPVNEQLSNLWNYLKLYSNLYLKGNVLTYHHIINENNRNWFPLFWLHEISLENSEGKSSTFCIHQATPHTALSVWRKTLTAVSWIVICYLFQRNKHIYIWLGMIIHIGAGLLTHWAVDKWKIMTSTWSVCCALITKAVVTLKSTNWYILFLKLGKQVPIGMLQCYVFFLREKWQIITLHWII